MKTNKKYYWLKLKEDFFTQPRIKKLRRIAGGDTYTLIYLKLQLLSLQNSGSLIFEGIEETFYDELALTIDEDPENVKMTMMYLIQHKLVEEISPDEYELVETKQNIGCESASTIRSRKSRENKKALQCNTSATPMQQTATKCNTDIDIEIDIERRDREKRKEIDIEDEQDANLFDVFESEFSRPLSQMEVQTIAEMENRYDETMILYALKLSVKNGARTLAYIESILNNWNAKGIRTVAEAQEESIRFKKRKSRPSERTLPEWYRSSADTEEQERKEEVDMEEFNRYLKKVKEGAKG